MVADKMNAESKPEVSGDGAAVEQASNAKASSIAGQLMGNPLVLEAIQNKLSGMVGGPSGYIKSLPLSMQKRVKALKKLQFEATKIEAEFYKDIHELECAYAAKFAPVHSKRRDIVTGAYEPTEEECDWPSDEEDEDEEEEGQKPETKQIKDAEDEEPSTGISSFWSTSFKNIELLSNMVQEQDEPILECLTDVTVALSSKPMGFTLEFHFDENDYFTDKVLTKWYAMRSEPDENDPLGFAGPEIVSCKGCKINWKDGKNVTVTTMKKKQKNAKTGKERTITKTVQADSFFNFFSPPEVPELNEEEEEIDEDTETLLQADYEIGHFIRTRIVPQAVMYFTGEAVDDDEDDESDLGEDDEDYDEDEDPDFDPASDPKAAAAAKDCKQQ